MRSRLLPFILIILPALFFWRLLIPHGPDQMQIAAGDFTEQYFPLRAFSAQQWVRGEIPLWNPYLYGGQPALADIQSGALYPPHVLQALILGWGAPLLTGQEVGFPLWAQTWQLILHFSIASLGTYLFVRQTLLPHTTNRPSLADWGGFIAALSFTYSGYLTGFPVQQLTILEVASWLPWVLWAIETRRIGAGAVCYALAILAGHPQTTLYVVYLSLAYGIVRYAIKDRREKIDENTSSFRTISYLLSSTFYPIILGCALAAPQLLPTLEFICYSVRADLNYDALSTGLPWPELAAIIYPGYFGGSPQYVGLVSLVLVAVLIYHLSQHNLRQILFWSLTALLSLILALGGNSFLYPLFYLLLPGFEMVRQQERVFLWFSFAIAVLAGWGSFALVHPNISWDTVRLWLKRLIGIGVLLAIILIFGATRQTAQATETNLFIGVLRHHLFGVLILTGLWALFSWRELWHKRQWGLALLAGWMAFNLFTINWQVNLHPIDRHPFTADSVVQFLQEQTNGERVVSGGILPDGNSAASVFGLRDLTGNTPLHLARTAQFLSDLPSWRMWQLMNVRYIVADRDLGSGGLEAVYQAGDQRIYEMLDPFPLVWFVGQTTVEADDSQAIRWLADEQTDLRQQAVILEPLSTELSPSAEASYAVIARTPTHLTLHVHTDAPKLMLISQIWYPGWRVWLNGQTVPLHRANVVQQAVVVPAGQHTVELHYAPTSFWLGVVFTLIGGMLTIGASTRWRK